MKTTTMLMLGGLILLGAAGCDSMKKLFEEKPPVKSNGKPIEPPPDENGGKPKQVVGEEVENTRPVPDRFAYPKGTPVGTWARWRYRYEEWDKEFVQELVVIGKQGENLWIEETTNIQGFDELVWRLVTPKGKVLMAYRGKPGSKGKRHKVVANTEAEVDPLAGATDSGKQESVTVPGGTFSCKLQTTGEGGKIWISSKVPFTRLVKFEGEDVKQVLLAHGSGRKKGKLARELPVHQGK